MMAKGDREAFFNGRKDENGKTIDRGLIGIRELKAAEEIRATMERLQDVRNGRK
jgi:hypothetical protein